MCGLKNPSPLDFLLLLAAVFGKLRSAVCFHSNSLQFSLLAGNRFGFMVCTVNCQPDFLLLSISPERVAFSRSELQNVSRSLAGPLNSPWLHVINQNVLVGALIYHGEAGKTRSCHKQEYFNNKEEIKKRSPSGTFQPLLAIYSWLASRWGRNWMFMDAAAECLHVFPR